MNKELLSTLSSSFRNERPRKDLWPAVKGSLAKIYKPCIRKKCAVCERGEKHPAWILTTSQKGRRRCLYVPEELVPTLQQAIQNGRKLEALLCDMGPAIVQAYRCQRDRPKKAEVVRSKS
jgi:hypothetical protein